MTLYNMPALIRIRSDPEFQSEMLRPHEVLIGCIQMLAINQKKYFLNTTLDTLACGEKNFFPSLFETF
jgi:hypothetical protein